MVPGVRSHITFFLCSRRAQLQLDLFVVLLTQDMSSRDPRVPGIPSPNQYTPRYYVGPRRLLREAGRRVCCVEHAFGRLLRKTAVPAEKLRPRDKQRNLPGATAS